ncbi:MAG: four helix bundle protein [Candidatus Saganbacteria bacterium]|nr:four helix bundle protein [Candidatus Saganbacteria bacterium]
MAGDEIRNPNLEIRKNLEIRTAKGYDLEDRSMTFALRINDYISYLPKTISNLEISKQLVRSAGSIGANYIEANESLGRKDFVMHIKISRKEAKESRYWLLLSKPSGAGQEEKLQLIKEANELMNIFGAIYRKSCPG